MHKNFSFSNIAWPTSDDLSVAELFQSHGITAIDIAPGKYFTDFANTTPEQISKVKTFWLKHDIQIIGMQALLFGTSGLNVFDTFEVQEKMLKHLDHICRIAAELGSTKLVFGSPKNRDIGNHTQSQVADIAFNFFNKLGQQAQKHGVTICLEPNPKHYGANFMITAKETAQVVLMVNHPSIRMQLDTGAVTMNQENIEDILKEYSSLIGHIHLSEPDLIPLGDFSADHFNYAKHIKRYLPTMPMTVEMRATENEPPLDAVKRALTFLLATYN